MIECGRTLRFGSNERKGQVYLKMAVGKSFPKSVHNLAYLVAFRFVSIFFLKTTVNFCTLSLLQADDTCWRLQHFLKKKVLCFVTLLRLSKNLRTFLEPNLLKWKIRVVKT